MIVKRARWAERDHYPFLVLTTDHGEVWIDHEQRYLARFGAVFVGSRFEDLLPVISVKVAGETRRLIGFTQAGQVAKLAIRFCEAVFAGTFEPNDGVDVPLLE